MADHHRMSWPRLLAWATLAALLAVVVAVGQGSATVLRTDGVDAVVVSPQATSAAVTAVAARPERLVPTGTVTAVSLAVVIVAMTLAGLIGPTRRRIGDVGDRWRRLLLGAPPAAV